MTYRNSLWVISNWFFKLTMITYLIVWDFIVLNQFLGTRIEIDKLAVGQILELIADDPAAEEDIPRLVKNIG